MKINRAPVGVFCILFTILALLCQHTAVAQLQANFNSTTPAGCAPLIVNFTDASTGSPESWRWDLGNGTVSTLKNPTASYFNPGTYAVKLVVKSGNNVDSVIRQQYITVYQKPVPKFTSNDSSGCFPLAVSFTDQSLPGSGTIKELAWDFGDGTTSTEFNPVHVYLNAGKFTVSVKVTNSNGCTSVFTRAQYIEVTNGVRASFTNTTAATCETNPQIQFTNTSTGPGNLGYEWNFGDGAVSAVESPAHTYTTPGTYTVSLVVISPQGCRDTVRKINLVSVGSINSGFTSPDSVCVSTPFTLVNTSSPMPGQESWNFGDGETAAGPNPVKVYQVAGTYQIRLINNFGACRDTVIRQIVVLPKTAASFTASAVTSCQVPFPVTFTAGSTGQSYFWDFGDGNTSTLANPSHTYLQTGSYDVKLVLVNSLGCTDTLVKTKYISITEPVITITGFPRTGCLPMLVQPVATITSTDAVTSYEWNFGDGTTSSAATPSHTYTRPGTYNVTLTITTATGCKKTLVVPAAVRAGAKPDADFSVQPNDVCASQAVQFNDNSTSNIDQWLWNFGDGGTSTQQNPRYNYGDTGYFNVTLVVWSNTCSDTIRYNNIVHIKPPIARFEVGNDCALPYRKRFTDFSLGAETWTWTFGDGQGSTLQSPVHTYSAPGAYEVILVVTNGSCTNLSRRTIMVIDETPVITSDKSPVCKNDPVSFSADNVRTSNIQSWSWNFGDGTPAVTTATSATHTYTTSGTFRVKLSIRDLLGCTDTTSFVIRVNGPQAAFSATVPSVCLGTGPVNFLDASATDGVNAITKYKWVYGDGLSDSTTSGPFTHTYASQGNYTVALTITDLAGCSSTVVREQAIIISKPTASFYSPDTSTCISKPVSFINTSAATEPTYQWTLGDGSSSTEINPVHSYTQVGSYPVTLLVTDKYGCRDTATKNNYILISLPVAGFTVSDSIGSCPPLRVEFTGKSMNAQTVRWDFGDGNTSVLPDPIHTYTFPGVYIAKQTVTGPGGCEDVITKRIVVKGPTGTFDYTPKIGCNPLTVTFTAETKNRTSFLWDFTDGNTEFTTDSIVSHTYTTAGDYVPRMILTDAAGCNVPLQGKDTIHVVGVKVDFEPDISTVCDQGTVRFLNKTVSNDYISSWLWKFGDGATSNQQHPVHYYSQPGVYRVVLIATSAFGCADSMASDAAVRVFARPQISITGDTASCLPASARFNGNVLSGNPAGLTWNWTFGNGQSSDMRNPTAVVYNNAGTYIITAVVTDTNTCRDTATHSFIAHPLPVVNAGPDLVYCVGTPVQLRATGALSYTWLNPQGLSCTTCDAPLAAPTNNSMYTVEGINQFGCAARDSAWVRVRRPITVKTSADDTLCAGESVKLLASGADLYTWTPSLGLSATNIAAPVASPRTTTTYVVTGRDSDGCFSDTADIFIKVYPVPVVEAGPDLTMPAGGSVTLQAKVSADVMKYTWSPAFQISCTSCTTAVATPRKTQEYAMTVKNEGGCTSRDDVKVFVTCNNGNLFIPNTFSPNGNGSNDRFYPRGTGIHKIKSLRIFNRWGEVVFEAQNFNVNDASAGWDGTYKGRALPADVFIYTCEVVCMNDEILEYKGDITLLK